MSEKDDILAEFHRAKELHQEFFPFPHSPTTMELHGKARTFDTGATRDTDEGKIDPEGFLDPRVIRRFCEYMNKNRIQSDGELRASDNWKKGIPTDVYMKSKWRHFLASWELHRMAIAEVDPGPLIESLCAELFNTMGYLYELLKEQ